MEPITNKNLKGNWVSLFLKINEDDSIDYKALENQIDYYIDCKVDGIYSNGTAGEFYTQSFEEYKQINSILAAKCESAQMPFQIGASHMSPQESLNRVRYAATLQPSAIQVILPDWFPTNKETQVNFLNEIVKVANGIGIVIYNPPHAKVLLKPSDYEYLLDRVDGIVGIKTAGGNDKWYQDMKEVFEKVSVFIPGHFLASGIKRGAKGSYSNVAAINPKTTQRWYEMTQKNIDEAIELEKRILLFMDEQIAPYITKRHYPNHACDKFMVRIGGWCDMSTRLRWPYIGIDEVEVETVRKKAELMIPEFFD